MPGKPITQPCGTRSAYARHLRHDETPCRKCKDANNSWHKNHRQHKHTRSA